MSFVVRMKWRLVIDAPPTKMKCSGNFEFIVSMHAGTILDSTLSIVGYLLISSRVETPYQSVNSSHTQWSRPHESTNSLSYMLWVLLMWLAESRGEKALASGLFSGRSVPESVCCVLSEISRCRCFRVYAGWWEFVEGENKHELD
jgi:hypothetical protein